MSQLFLNEQELKFSDPNEMSRDATRIGIMVMSTTVDKLASCIKRFGCILEPEIDTLKHVINNMKYTNKNDINNLLYLLDIEIVIWSTVTCTYHSEYIDVYNNGELVPYFDKLKENMKHMLN